MPEKLLNKTLGTEEALRLGTCEAIPEVLETLQGIGDTSTNKQTNKQTNFDSYREVKSIFGIEDIGEPFFILHEQAVDLTGIDENSPHATTIKEGLRQAVRAVVVNDQGEVALMHVAGHNYYKLPGGGIDPGEDHIRALIRELSEETGIQHTGGILSYQGYIVEVRRRFNQVQNSHVYVVRHTGVNTNKPEGLTDLERAQGFEFGWYPIREAMRLLRTNNSDNYEGRIIARRDFEILFYAVCRNRDLKLDGLD